MVDVEANTLVPNRSAVGVERASLELLVLDTQEHERSDGGGEVAGLDNVDGEDGSLHDSELVGAFFDLRLSDFIPDFVALACVVGHHAYAFGDALFEVILGIDVGANELFDGDLSVVVLVQSAEQLVHYFSGKLPVAPSVQEVGQLLQRHSSVSVHIDRRKF